MGKESVKAWIYVLIYVSLNHCAAHLKLTTLYQLHSNKI